MAPILRIEGLNAGYGRLRVLFDISFSVDEREILAIVGPNGSGKSTLLKSIFGLTNIYSGKVIFNGEDITGIKPHIIARKGLVYLPQVENVFSKLTVRENLLMAGYKLPKQELKQKIESVLELLPVLRKYMDNKAFQLSGGERQMLALAMALMGEPKLIMLDEPSTGLAPKISNYIFERIKKLRDMGITVLIVEQNAMKALKMADRALLLAAGKKIFEGECNALLSRKDLVKLYLGLEVSPSKVAEASA